ncbi:hypothetical protein ACRRTK_000885 [Alexandromys fortis]
MALAQRLGLKESHIKMWFKNRRARQNRKNSQEVPGEPGSGSHDRPACPQGSVPLGTSASADSLRQSPELQNHPSTVSEPNKCDDQKVHPEAPRKQRKERTVYSEEQKVLLQRYFVQEEHPNLQQRKELARMIGVTEYEIKIWFKNQRAKNKKNHLRKTHEVLPESNGSSNDVSVPTQFHLHNIESMSLVTPDLSLQASLHDDLAIEDTHYSPQEDLLVHQAPVVASNPGQPTVAESQLYPAVAEWAASMEAPVSTTEGVHGPNNVQYLYPTFQQF